MLGLSLLLHASAWSPCLKSDGDIDTNDITLMGRKTPMEKREKQAGKLMEGSRSEPYSGNGC